ncbi:MAG TPA: hypothetical protein VFN39_12325 [Gemmatimonadaceae bacterium]|nr:hypothetical protein [Gemmatimonadaceae bacterium]
MRTSGAIVAAFATALVLGGCSPSGRDAAGGGAGARQPPAESAAPAPVASPARDTARDTAGDGKIADVAVGQEHSCALTTGGSAFCWGSNEARQLGSGNDSSTLAPVPVAGTHHFIAISAGAGYTCALDERGAAWCWGTGERGQLGTGRPSDSSRVPVAVQTARRFAAISSSVSHSCAVERTGAVWCWGANESGQLGAATPALSALPVSVDGHSFRDVAAGPSFTCATTVDGGVDCWGVGTPNAGSAGPLPIPGLHEIVAVSAGANVTCAIDSSGAGWCWGANDFGQLGAGRLDRRDAPVRAPLRIATDAPLVHISVGDGRSCAIAAGGALFCWGINDNHVLGANTTEGCPVEGRVIPCAPQPVNVAPALRFARIAVSQYHSCGATIDGRLYCWGTSMNGNLGSGDDSDVAEPREVRLP